MLHNNVGINAPGGAAEASEESWRRVLDVNLTSVFLTCRAVLPIMEAQGKGAIVNIASLAAIRWTGYPYVSYYASKAGVCHLTRAIAVEYAARGVRANTILPGIIDTPHVYKQIAGYHSDVEEMRAKRAALVPMKRQGDAWDIAWASVFLASDEAKFITGIELPVDGGHACTVAGQPAGLGPHGGPAGGIFRWTSCVEACNARRITACSAAIIRTMVHNVT